MHIGVQLSKMRIGNVCTILAYITLGAVELIRRRDRPHRNEDQMSLSYLRGKIGVGNGVTILNENRLDATQNDIFGSFNAETAHARDEYTAVCQTTHCIPVQSISGRELEVPDRRI
jgi:hypothetical protein